MRVDGKNLSLRQVAYIPYKFETLGIERRNSTPRFAMSDWKIISIIEFSEVSHGAGTQECD